MNKTKKENTKLNELWFLVIYIEIVLLYTHIYSSILYNIYGKSIYTIYDIWKRINGIPNHKSTGHSAS